LSALPGLVSVDDADRVDQLRVLEEIKAATAAAQARKVGAGATLPTAG
jgi:hypothetical protein